MKINIVISASLLLVLSIMVSVFGKEISSLRSQLNNSQQQARDLLNELEYTKDMCSRLLRGGK